MEANTVVNGIVAQDTTQATALWGVRERITEALQKDGAVYKYDVSLPLPTLYSLVCLINYSPYYSTSVLACSKLAIVCLLVLS